jgi:hypothetical protein
MRQRPATGLGGFGLLAITHSPCCRSAGIEGISPLPKAISWTFLRPWRLKHPHQRVVFQAERQGPVRVQQVNLRHLSDCCQVRRPAALADAEPGVDVGQAHVGHLALVVEEVDLTRWCRRCGWPRWSGCREAGARGVCGPVPPPACAKARRIPCSDAHGRSGRSAR